MSASAWTWIPLQEIAPANGLTEPSADDMVWCLSLEDIESQTGRVLRRSQHRFSEMRSAKAGFDERHVLYSKLRPYLNKVVVPDYRGIGTSELIPLRPNPERLDREFLAFYLRSPLFVDFAIANTRGANLPRISMAELWKHSVPVPDSLSEQRRIVARIKECMDRVEEIERLRAEALDESQSLAAALYEAIEAGETWPILSVGKVVKRSRNGRSIAQRNENPSGYVLSLSAVRDVTLDCECKKPIRLQENIAGQFAIKAGDLFVSRSNTRELVGLASVAEATPAQTIYPDLLIRLEVDPAAIRPRFLAYALRTTKSRIQIRERAVGTSQSMVKISAERLKEVLIHVPPLAVQDQLLQELDRCHGISVAVRQEIQTNCVARLRDAILRKAFAGEM
jgi:type I restriction enzyme S subunit